MQRQKPACQQQQPAAALLTNRKPEIIHSSFAECEDVNLCHMIIVNDT
jgi:hypothetical protein